MAKVTHDVYNILDENGNVVGQQIYPQGGSLYSGAQSDRAAGRNPEVYYSAPEQQYVPVREAKAQITFSPETNKITIKGPKWLTGEIKNSDWFKKQYSQNSVVSQLMRTVKDNPDGADVLRKSGRINAYLRCSAFERQPKFPFAARKNIYRITII